MINLFFLVVGDSLDAAQAIESLGQSSATHAGEALSGAELAQPGRNQVNQVRLGSRHVDPVGDDEGLNAVQAAAALGVSIRMFHRRRALGDYREFEVLPRKTGAPRYSRARIRAYKGVRG